MKIIVKIKGKDFEETIAESNDEAELEKQLRDTLYHAPKPGHAANVMEWFKSNLWAGEYTTLYISNGVDTEEWHFEG